jgi:hypothetical protein
MAIGTVLHIVFIAAYLLLFGVDVVQGFSTFSAAVLALTFVFGGARAARPLSFQPRRSAGQKPCPDLWELPVRSAHLHLRPALAPAPLRHPQVGL